MAQDAARSNWWVILVLAAATVVGCTSDEVPDLVMDEGEVSAETESESDEEPVSIPSRPLGTRAVADDSPPRVESGPNIANDEAGIEISDATGTIRSIVEVDDRFVAYGQEGQRARLWESVDALLWTEIETSGLPTGQLVGFAHQNGEFLVAINALDIPPENDNEVLAIGEPAYEFPPTIWPEIDITIWRSDDAASWEPSDEHQSFRGVAAQFHQVFFEPNGWNTTLRIPREISADGRLVQYLSTVVDSDTALATCWARRVGRGEGQILDLYDCDQELLVSIPAGEAPAKFIHPDCVQSHRWSDEAKPVFRRFANDGRTLEIEAPHYNAGFAALAGETPVFVDRWPRFDITSVCQTEQEKSRSPGATVQQWNPDTQTLDNIATPPGANNLGQAWMYRSAEGTYILTSKTQVWEADALGEPWSLRIAHPSWVTGRENPRKGVLLSEDGSLAVALEPGRIHLELTRGDWTPVDLNARLDYARILLVTDTHLLLDPGGWPSLIRIQLR